MSEVRWFCRAAVLLVGLGAGSAKAQDRELEVEEVSLDALLERNLDDQLGTTTAVSRGAEQVLTAPAAMSTLRSEQIRHSGARSVPDLLRWVPGVQVFRIAPGNYIVSLRGTGGLNGNNVVVLVNGVPVNSPLDASVDWDLIPVHVFDIDYIEIVRGPVGTVYGANAYTGVINIVTRDAYGRSSSAAARAEAGADTALGLLGGLSGRYTAATEALRAAVFAMGEADGTGRSGREGDTQTAYRAGALTHLQLRLAQSSRLVLDIAASRSSRSSLDHLVQESHPQTRSLVLGSLRWSFNQPSGVAPSLDAWARTAAQLTESNAASYTGFSYAGTKSNRAALGTDAGFNLATELRLKLGTQADFDWVEAPYLNPSANDELYLGYGYYGNLEYAPLEHLHLTLGARGDVPTGSPELKLSYRASLVWDAVDWAMRLAAASGYRAPSYVERGGRFLDRSTGLILLEGDPELERPSNDTIELGLITAPHATVHLMPTLYVSRLSNVIVEDFESLVRRTFRNDPSPRYLLGSELEASWQAREDLTLLLNFGSLHWLEVDEAVMATVAVPGQASTLVAGLRVFGSLLNERIGYGFGANFSSERSFALRAGIPPRIIDQELAPQTHAFASGEYSLGVTTPLWLGLRVFAALPHAQLELPMPAAAVNSSSIVLSLVYREE